MAGDIKESKTYWIIGAHMVSCGKFEIVSSTQDIFRFLQRVFYLASCKKCSSSSILRPIREH